ncbi:MAG: hypothetical protein ABW163_10890 [Luteimonas sp.]
MHALRNAVNAIAMSVALSRRLLQEGESARAEEALERADLALQRVSSLMRQDAGTGRILHDATSPKG